MGRAVIRRLLADENGNATILGAFMIAALAGVLVLIISVGAAVVARHRAQSAADLSALAAAVEHSGGGGEPCTAARSLAEAQRPRVELAACALDGSDVVVSVRVPVSLGSFGLRTAVAHARAGPAG